MSRLRPSPVPSRLVRAAGAVVWRTRHEVDWLKSLKNPDPQEMDVLLVHRPRYNDWSWPKGKTERDETLPVAAVREVEEETGHAVILGAPLTTQRYRLGSGQVKEVYYWVGRCAASDPSLTARRPVALASTREIDESRWVSVSKAKNLLTRRGDRRLLKEVMSRAENGTLVTSTLVMVRHAKAQSRSTWTDADLLRPLSRMGAQQTLDLVDLFSAFGITSLASSPATRCVSTLGPYASLIGAQIGRIPELTEPAMEEHPEAGEQVFADLLQRVHEPTAVCVHQPTIPALLVPIRNHAAQGARLVLPTDKPWLSTAQLLVSHVAHPGAGQRAARDVAEVLGVETHVTYTKLRMPS